MGASEVVVRILQRHGGGTRVTKEWAFFSGDA